MDNPSRYFKLKANRRTSSVAWLNRHTVYQGRLISMASRIVRLFAPDPGDPHPHVDLSYDWVTPVP